MTELNIIGEYKELSAKEAFKISSKVQKEKDVKILRIIMDEIEEAASNPDDPKKSVTSSLPNTEFSSGVIDKLTSLGYKLKFVSSLLGKTGVIISWRHFTLDDIGDVVEELPPEEEKPDPNPEEPEEKPGDDNGNTEPPKEEETNPDEGTGEGTGTEEIPDSSEGNTDDGAGEESGTTEPDESGDNKEETTEPGNETNTEESEESGTVPVEPDDSDSTDSIPDETPTPVNPDDETISE